MSSRGIICEEPPQRCELCGVIAETRPYGENGEEICYDCGMQNREVTEAKMEEYLFGVSKQ